MYAPACPVCTVYTGEETICTIYIWNTTKTKNIKKLKLLRHFVTISACLGLCLMGLFSVKNPACGHNIPFLGTNCKNDRIPKCTNTALKVQI